jgi:hypothetical protein
VTDDPTRPNTDGLLFALRLQHEQEQRELRATTSRQEPLPFDGDGSYLADATPQFHGSTVGVYRHTEAGEPLCGPCAAWVTELTDAGYAQSAGVTSDESRDDE